MHVNRCCNSCRQKDDEERSLKVFKYKELTIEIHHIWNVKAKVISVIIGVNETISKTLKQYLSNVQRKHEFEEITETNHIGHGTQTGERANVKQKVKVSHNRPKCPKEFGVG
jgi:hypothetical protein